MTLATTDISWPCLNKALEVQGAMYEIEDASLFEYRYLINI